MKEFTLSELIITWQTHRAMAVVVAPVIMMVAEGCTIEPAKMRTEVPQTLRLVPLSTSFQAI